jgi:outer membrane protein
MKKLAVGLITAISLASADFIGATVGAGMWQENIDGYIKTDDDLNYFNKEDNNPKTGNLKLSDEVKPYVWAKIIHPVPLIPNVRAEYRQYHTTGKNGNAVGSVKVFGATVFKGRAQIDTDITIDSYDVTAFYELKLFFEVEAGIGVTLLDGTTETLVNKTDKNTANWTVPIPYLYGRVETPTLLGFSVEAQGKYVDVTDAYYHDYQGAIKYHLPIPVIDFTLSAGYKTQEIYGKDGDNETKMKFEGAYAELGARW